MSTGHESIAADEDAVATTTDDTATQSILTMSKNQLKRMRKRQLRLENRSEWRKEKKRQQKERKQQRQENTNLPDKDTESDQLQRKKQCREQIKDEDKQPSMLHLLIDAGFEDGLMNQHEIASLAGQITRCYSANRIHRCPVQFTVCGLKGKLDQRFAESNFDYTRWDSRYISVVRDQNYLDILPAEQLVYLTADSPNIITELDESKVYIIGGLVDKNRHKCMCLRKAEEQGIATARLPIGEFIQMSTRKILAVNHVFEILLNYLDSRDWNQAFLAVIPERKFKKNN